eukprot:TRINITY_DN17038_c0_g1_i2.p1 TRINITY_DN17038_c0_g1~~TRINITY_DN17038_c0_g1_i2.p1  ORF type:complete len:300 (+),score=18.40 TRINITY_DN17038_c0_g1_i2:22-900(+)
MNKPGASLASISSSNIGKLLDFVQNHHQPAQGSTCQLLELFAIGSDGVVHRQEKRTTLDESNHISTLVAQLHQVDQVLNGQEELKAIKASNLAVDTTAEKKPNSDSPSFVEKLPIDTLKTVFSYLPATQILTMPATARFFYELRDAIVWPVLSQRLLGEAPRAESDGDNRTQFLAAWKSLPPTPHLQNWTFKQVVTATNGGLFHASGGTKFMLCDSGKWLRGIGINTEGPKVGIVVFPMQTTLGVVLIGIVAEEDDTESGGLLLHSTLLRLMKRCLFSGHSPWDVAAGGFLK